MQILNISVTNANPTKYASHPYPILVGGDTNIPTVNPLDITLRWVLKDTHLHEINFTSVNALDFSMESSLRYVSLSDKSMMVSVSALDFNLTSVLRRVQIDDDKVVSTVKALDFTKQRKVVDYKHPDKKAFKPTVKALSFTRKGV